jgi:hypothetical protein
MQAVIVGIALVSLIPPCVRAFRGHLRGLPYNGILPEDSKCEDNDSEGNTKPNG